MDLRRLIRMTVGGLVCLVIGAVSAIAISSMLFGIADGSMRLVPWIGLLLLIALALETFVLTVAGLILVTWALVASIAGPPAMQNVSYEMAQPSPVPARSSLPRARVGAIATATLDPQKRRPPHA